jgi:Holliday junction resolvasome RuvABC endonuclease subunit
MSYVWGIDPGLERVAFAYCDGPLTWTNTLTVPDGDPALATKLERLYRQVRTHARHQLDDRDLPDCVWVEQPSGLARNLRLVYAVGIIQAALYGVTGAPVWTIAPSAWKRRTVGRGNATKLEVFDWVCTDRQIGARSQDEADAAAIALAGAAMFDQRSWEATAT